MATLSHQGNHQPADEGDQEEWEDNGEDIIAAEGGEEVEEEEELDQAEIDALIRETLGNDAVVEDEEEEEGGANEPGNHVDPEDSLAEDVVHDANTSGQSAASHSPATTPRSAELSPPHAADQPSAKSPQRLEGRRLSSDLEGKLQDKVNQKVAEEEARKKAQKVAQEETARKLAEAQEARKHAEQERERRQQEDDARRLHEEEVRRREAEAQVRARIEERERREAEEREAQRRQREAEAAAKAEEERDAAAVAAREAANGDAAGDHPSPARDTTATGPKPSPSQKVRKLPSELRQKPTTSTHNDPAPQSAPAEAAATASVAEEAAQKAMSAGRKAREEARKAVEQARLEEDRRAQAASEEAAAKEEEARKAKEEAARERSQKAEQIRLRRQFESRRTTLDAAEGDSRKEVESARNREWDEMHNEFQEELLILLDLEEEERERQQEEAEQEAERQRAREEQLRKEREEAERKAKEERAKELALKEEINRRLQAKKAAKAASETPSPPPQSAPSTQPAAPPPTQTPPESPAVAASPAVTASRTASKAFGLAAAAATIAGAAAATQAAEVERKAAAGAAKAEQLSAQVLKRLDERSATPGSDDEEGSPKFREEDDEEEQSTERSISNATSSSRKKDAALQPQLSISTANTTFAVPGHHPAACAGGLLDTDTEEFFQTSAGNSPQKQDKAPTADGAASENKPIPPLAFEKLFEEEKQLGLSKLVLSDKHPALTVTQVLTKREEGRCLEPTLDEEPQRPVGTHHEVLLGHFTSKQILFSPSSKLPSKVTPPVRERTRPEAVSLGTMHCVFEKEVGQGASGTEEQQDGATVPFSTEEMEKAPLSAVSSYLAKVSTPDALQLWEVTRGSPPLTILGGGTATKVYTYDYEPKKSAAMIPMFSNGTLLEITVKRMMPSLHALFGVDAEPVFGALAIYNINPATKQKVSETFYFDLGTEKFFAISGNKQLHPSQRHQSFATYIPFELTGSPLYLVFRLYRLSGPEHSELMDMYCRTARYKEEHVATAKQKIQSLATFSACTQELGWFALPLIAPTNKLIQGDQVIENLYISYENLSDNSMADLVLNELKRNKLKKCLCNLVLNIADVSKDEVSFPHQGETTMSIEQESVICLQNTEQMRAPRRIMRYCPYRVSSTNAGFYNFYCNVLYLRLHGLNFSRYSGIKWNSSNTNIGIQVCLKDNDASLSPDGLPAVFCRSLATSVVDVSGWSNVTFYNKEPEFHDEFKIQLPLVLHERHHLFFTFWQLPLKVKEQAKILGYAVLPIFAGNTLLVKENVQLPVMTVEGASALQSSYLVRAAQLPPKSYVADGQPVFSCATFARSTIYSDNPKTSTFLSRMQGAMREVSRDHGVLNTSGVLQTLSANLDNAHLSYINQFLEIPFAEQLTAYPMYAGMLLGMTASRSQSVGYVSRSAAFNAFLDMSLNIHQWEVKATRPVKTANGKPTVVRSSPMTWLYHFMTNNLLYNDVVFPVYAAVTEICLLELKKSDTSKFLLHLSDMIWFVYDIILRSIYLFVQPVRSADDASGDVAGSQSQRGSETARRPLPGGSPTSPAGLAADRQPAPAPKHQIDPSFYPVLADLICTIIAKLGPSGGTLLASRTAVLLRQLFRCCDRGAILDIVSRVQVIVRSQGVLPNTMTLVRILMECDQSLILSLPRPGARGAQFFLRLVLDDLLPLLVTKSPEHRTTALTFVYNFLLAAVQNPQADGRDCEGLAVGAWEVLEHISVNWSLLKTFGEKDSIVAQQERRQFIVIVIWVLQHTAPAQFKEWLNRGASSQIGRQQIQGLLCILGEAMLQFKYNAGKDKKNPRTLRQVEAEQKDLALPTPTEMMAADARFSTLVAIIGVRVASIVIVELPDVMASLREDRPLPIVNYFLTILDNSTQLYNSFTALEAGALLLYQTHSLLFPEFVSRKARNANGMVLLAIRLMSCSSKAVRRIATRCYLDTARRHLEVLGTLSKLKHFTASALVSVAESSNRNIARAGDCLRAEFRYLVEAGAVEPYTPLPTEVLKRFVPLDPEAVGDLNNSLSQAANASSAGFMQRNQSSIGGVDGSFMSPAIVSVEPLPVDLDRCRKDDNRQGASFSALFKNICDDMMALLDEVMMMQSDSGVKLQELKTFQTFQICRTFMKQNSLQEALKWYHRLADLHLTRKDYVEAAMTKVYIAAIGYQASFLYYKINGNNATGCKLPFAFFTHVFWHHYTRLLPQLDVDLSMETLYPMVVDMATTPDDKAFSVEGQSHLLNEAAQAFAKQSHFELALTALRVVDFIAEAVDDFDAMVRIHDQMRTWSQTMSEGKKTESWRRRVSARYFYLSIRHPSKPNECSEQIYRMSPLATLNHFQSFVIQFVESLHGTGNILFDDGAGNYTSPQGQPVVGSAKQIAAIREGKVILRMYPVAPVPEPEYQDLATPVSYLHKTCYYRRFQSCTRVNAETKQPIPDVPPMVQGRSIVHPSNADVRKHQVTLTEHVVEVGFPFIVSFLSVVETSKKALPATDSAMQTLEDQYAYLYGSGTGDALVQALKETMSPMGFQPPGSYYKLCLQHLAADCPDILTAVTNYIKLVKEKLSAVDQYIQRKDPDSYPGLLKGLVDMECSLEVFKQPPS